MSAPARTLTDADVAAIADAVAAKLRPQRAVSSSRTIEIDERTQRAAVEQLKKMGIMKTGGGRR
jgi:hypothetical protein